MNDSYDLIVIGSGAAGMMAAITAAKNGQKVVIIEKQSTLGIKLKATGGGRCNLTNTLKNEEFLAKFGKNGRFMQDALQAFNAQDLLSFFADIGVKTHAPDGFRVFPITHNSSTILDALTKVIKDLKIETFTDEEVVGITPIDNLKVVTTKKGKYRGEAVVVATGGAGYPALGASKNSYEIPRGLGHKVTELSPAMTPLVVKEKWVGNCRADTIGKATVTIDLKKYKKLKLTGDIIFTKNGIRGPVVLDFSREVTPLLETMDEVPILITLTGENEDTVLKHFKSHPTLTVLEALTKLLPTSVATELLNLVGADLELTFSKHPGVVREKIVKIASWTPLTVIGSNGFDTAMVTRGGVSLKEIDPKTMESRICKGVYFCGEVLDLDGPCGGYNLQWSFSSGFLAGSSVNSKQ